MKKDKRKGKLLNLGRLYDATSSLYTYIPYHLFPPHAFPPLHLFVELTYRCNVRCEMCQFLPLLEGTELTRKKAEEISADEIIEFVRTFPRTTVVTLTGGEPFLKKDLPQIIESLAKRNKIHIITNGTLLTEENVSFLWEHRLRSIWGGGVLAIGVSLQGPRDVHDGIVGRKGAFEAACTGIRLLNSFKQGAEEPFPHIHTTAVITDKNASYLAEMYEESRKLDVEYCNFTLFNSSDFSNRLDIGNVTDFPDAQKALGLPGDECGFWDRDSPDKSGQAAPRAVVESRRKGSTPVSPRVGLHETHPPNKMMIDSAILREQFRLIDEIDRGNETKIRFSPFAISREEIIKYYRNEGDVSRFRCNSPWRMLGVSAYGDVSSCPLISIGNIRVEKTAKLWNGPKQARFRRDLKKRGIFPVCLGCCQSIYRGGGK